MRDEHGEIVFPDFERKTFLIGGYTKQLDEYAEQLEDLADELIEEINSREKQIDKLKEQIHQLELANAKAGNRLYQADAENWGKQWNELNIAYGKVQAENSSLKYMNQFLQERLDMYESTEKPIPKEQKQRDEKSGKFVSVIPKAEKEKTAYQMKNQGYSFAEIGHKLGVTADSAKRYYQSQKAREQAAWEEIERINNGSKEETVAY